jgi:hypothetical protein
VCRRSSDRTLITASVAWPRSIGRGGSGSPSLNTTDSGTFDGDSQIALDVDEANNKIVIYLNGSGSEDYAKVTVTGVTKLDLTDFEFS